MKRAALVTALFAFSGCAAVNQAPGRISDSWTDPVRRAHVAERIVESGIGAIAGIAAYEGTCLLFKNERVAWYDYTASLTPNPETAPRMLLKYHPARSKRGCEKWWQYGTAILAGAAVTTAVEYAMFEFIFEPLGWGGHYWERGPRDSEKFVKP